MADSSAVGNYDPRNFGTKIELRVECAFLADQDYNSKSDPFVVLYSKEAASNPDTPWRPIAKTETVHDQLSPKFATPFTVHYVFEKPCHMRFEVYDEDSAVRNLERDLKKQDFLGYAETDLATLVHSPGQSQTMSLRTKKGKKQKNNKGRLSMITFYVEEVSECVDVVHLELAADKLPKMDWFGKGDPYFEIHRLREDQSWVKCYKSEVIKNSKTPKWKPKSIPMQTLNNGDSQRPIKILVFDWNKNDSPDFYGEVETSIEQMSEGGSFPLKNPTAKKKKNFGQVIVRRCDIEKRHSFMDYLAGGMDMQLLVAVDFTGSNGHPKDPGTLHYRNPNNSFISPYLSAIYNVGNILTPYDSDGQVPVWGFGAVVNRKVNHCFPMNMYSKTFTGNPEVSGVPGIVQAYHDLLDSGEVAFSGPTLFQSILHSAMEIARQPQPRDRVNYQILLILTDGVINDAQQTIDAIVQASGLPLSIIIVGIGDADFTQMEVLDGDDGVLRDARGRPAEGDIVQFVPLRQFDNMPPGALAEETLKEVPEQFLAYMRRHNIAPKPRTLARTQTQAEQALLSQQTIVGGDLHSRMPSSSAPASAPLPPGWEEKSDPQTGRIYYSDHNTGKNQWERPV